MYKVWIAPRCYLIKLTPTCLCIFPWGGLAPGSPFKVPITIAFPETFHLHLPWHSDVMSRSVVSIYWLTFKEVGCQDRSKDIQTKDPYDDKITGKFTRSLDLSRVWLLSRFWVCSVSSNTWLLVRRKKCFSSSLYFQALPLFLARGMAQPMFVYLNWTDL